MADGAMKQGDTVWVQRTDKDWVQGTLVHTPAPYDVHIWVNYPGVWAGQPAGRWEHRNRIYTEAEYTAWMLTR